MQLAALLLLCIIAQSDAKPRGLFGDGKGRGGIVPAIRRILDADHRPVARHKPGAIQQQIARGFGQGLRLRSGNDAVHAQLFP